MYLHDSDEGSIQIVSLRVLGVENLHRECAARNSENGLDTRILICKHFNHQIIQQAIDITPFE